VRHTNSVMADYPCLAMRRRPQTTCKVICDWATFWFRSYEASLASGKKHFPEMEGPQSTRQSVDVIVETFSGE